MVGIDATVRAKIMFGCQGIELIERERFLAFEEMNACERDGGSDCPSTPAQRTVATAHIHKPVRQIKLKRDSATVAAGGMFRLNRYSIDFLKIDSHTAPQVTQSLQGPLRGPAVQSDRCAQALTPALSGLYRDFTPRRRATGTD